MDKANFRATQVAAMALSCHLWSLSRLLRRAIMIPDSLKETLMDVQRRLERLSLSLLRDIDSHTYGLAGNINDCNRLDCGPGVSASDMAPAYSICKPLWAMAFALNDYDCSGGTGRKKNPCKIVAKTLDPPGHTENDPYDASACVILTKSILECEAQLYGSVVQGNLNLRRGTPVPSGPTTTDCTVDLHGSQLSVPLEIEFLTSRTVAIARWRVDVDDMAMAITVPDLNHLTFMVPENNKISKRYLEELYKLHKIVRISVHLARITHWYRVNLPAFHTTAGSHAGLRFLYDEFRTTIDRGRARVRDVELYERSLRISRKKGSERIVVRTIATQDLLNVAVRPQDTDTLTPTLEVYWRQKQQGVIGFAEFYFADPDAMRVWAAFLSANLHTAKEIGRYKLPALPRDMSLGDQDLRCLVDLKLRHILQLIPLAIQGELDLYSMESLNLHLVRLARKVFGSDTRVEA